MKKHLLLLIFLFASINFWAQQSQIRGIVLNELKEPLAGAEITFNNKKGTETSINGDYVLLIPANEEVLIKINYIGLKPVRIKVKLKPNEQYEFNPVLKDDVEQFSEVVITGTKKNDIEGVVNLDPSTIRNTPSANAGVEGLLKTLPGVSNNNELSTQYNVRGGNFDENLVYVNEIEVYRPFLVRSGQQEGLSFVNSDLVKNVNFSAGGFQAKYGDKLSSVLDVTYDRPTKKGAQAEFSLLGGSLALKGVSKNNKTSAILGARSRDNSLLVDARDTDSNFRPRFVDLQSYISHDLNSKVELSFLANVALNIYDFEPISKRTNFGTVNSPRELTVFFDGEEQDRYQTLFGAFKTTYKPNENLSLRFLASGYQTQEEENFDILAEYFISDVSAVPGSDNFDTIESIDGVGSEFSHARNALDAVIFNIEHLGTYTVNNSQFDWGVKYTREDIRDRLDEFEFISDAGFIVNDTFDETPFIPFDNIDDGVITPFNSVKADNEVVINRFSGFGQWSGKAVVGNDHQLWINTGIRAHQWKVDANGASGESQITVSPRAQLALKPNWNKDVLFRFSAGLYHQPPSFRELRDLSGTIIPDVKAQQSFHISLSNDFSFKMWNRPFKLTSEIYYKNLDDVNTYTLENVRIRYRANNNATAFAQGLDLRINGEFVPGTESWFSFGYLRTEENQDNRGYIARPTDQRLKFGVLFQDYVKNIPNLKLYLNLSYQTGLPGGSPVNADPFEFQGRLDDYRRVDVGTFYEIVGENKKARTFTFLNHFKTFEVGLEIFNIFDFRNSITNTFVRDADTLQEFAIPNFLTPRVLNFKMKMSL